MQGLRILRWVIYALCIAWIGASAWYIFLRDQEPDLKWQAFERQIDQKINDCRGTFQERYDCKSALLREKYVESFYWWSQRISVIFIPTLVILTILYFFLRRQARLREGERVVARLDRLDKQAVDARERAIEEGRRRAELARLKAEAKRRAAAHIKHILVIDNNAHDVDSLLGTLSRLGHEVGYVENLKSALLNFKESCYDLVIFDFFQEGNGGINGVKELRATGVPVKIIAASAGFAQLGHQDIERAAAKIGVDRILIKPLDYGQIAEIISEVLDGPANEALDDELPPAPPRIAKSSA